MTAKRKSKAGAAKPAQAAVVAAASGGPIALRRTSKGTRPQFYENEAIDQLFAVVTAMAAELSVAFDRIDTLERVLVGAGTLAADRVEAYQPSAAAAEERGMKREQLIQRVFAVFESYGANRRR